MDKFRPGERTVELGLYAVAAVSTFWAALWVAGTNGFGWIGWGNLPGWLDTIAAWRGLDWTSNPVVDVQLVRTADLESVVRGTGALNGDLGQVGTVPSGWGEFLYGGTSVQLWDLDARQRIAYVLLHVASCLVVALVAVTLARLVASSRSASPFTVGNVSRLRRIGALVLVGAPAASFAGWMIDRWIVGSSSVADRVRIHDYGWSSLPVVSMLVGAAVLVLADVWRRGVRMADDVEGLV